MFPTDTTRDLAGQVDEGLSRDLAAMDRELAALEDRLAEQRDERGNAELRPILDRMEQAAIVRGGERVLYANRAAARLFDAVAPELLDGRPALALIDESSRRAISDLLLARQEPANVAAKCVSASGQPFDTEIVVAGVVWSGRPATLWLFRAPLPKTDAPGNRDILASVRSEVLEDGLWDWNLRSGGILIGPRLRSLLDYAPGERDGWIGGWAELVHPDDMKRVDLCTRDHLSGSVATWQAEVRLRNAAGHYRWVRLRGKGLRDGDGTIGRVVGTANDVERLRKVEAELEAREDDLDRLRRLLEFRAKEVARLNRELNAARHQVAVAERVKTQFLANMSHELRTPLNAVIGFAEVIGQEMFGPISVPRYRDYARDILLGARNLLRLVDDILDLSWLKSGRAQLAEELVDPRAVILSVSTVFGSTAADMEVELDTRFDPALQLLWVDPRVFKQMVMTLVDCAIRCSVAGGNVEVRAMLAANGGVDVTVSDDGRGMTPDQMRRELAPLGGDGDWESRHEGARGLGLALIAAQIEMHDGHLEVDSAPGEGTRVVLHFPAARLRPRGAPTSPVPVSDPI